MAASSPSNPTFPKEYDQQQQQEQPPPFSTGGPDQHPDNTNSNNLDHDNEQMLNQYRLRLEPVLGRGSYGVVLLAHCPSPSLGPSDVAVKCLSKSLLKRQKDYTRVGRKMVCQTAFDDVQREIALMKKLSHSHVVRLIEVLDDQENDKLYVFVLLSPMMQASSDKRSGVIVAPLCILFLRAPRVHLAW